MGTYCAPTDITALTGVKYTATSQPAMAIVQGWCDTFSGELDNALRVVGIATPLDPSVSPVSAKIAAQYVAFKVAAIAETATYVGDGAAAGRAETYLKLYAELLRALKNGETLRFEDAVKTNQTPAERYTGLQSGNLLPDPNESQGPGEPPKPFFTQTMVF